MATSTSSRHLISPDAWQTKLQAAIGIPFPWFWLLFATTILVGALLILAFIEKNTSHLPFLAMQALLIGSIANAVVFSEKLLDEAADAFELLLDNQSTDIATWMNGWYDNIFWSKKNVLIGVAMALLLTISGWLIIPSLFVTWPAIGIACLLNIIMGLHAGSLLWIMIGIARLMLSLGNEVNIKVSIFDTATSPLRSASGVLWRISLVGALIYVLGVSMYSLCGIQMPTATLIIISVFGLFLVMYFIIPQINIHRTLYRIKQTRLSSLVLQIDRSFDTVTEHPSPENIAQLRQLFDLQHVVNGKRAWSFGTNELLLLIGSIAVPLALVILQHILNK